MDWAKYLVGSGHLAYAYGKVVVDQDYVAAAGEATKALAEFGFGSVVHDIQRGVSSAVPPLIEKGLIPPPPR
jgi:hypothetical protein